MKPFWVRKTILNWISTMLVSAFLILIASSATGEISSTIDVMNDTKNKHTVVPSVPQGELIAEDVKFAKGESMKSTPVPERIISAQLMEKPLSPQTTGFKSLAGRMVGF
ncbi:MAG: hypothetical protein V8Q79_00270 [Christensenellales bacterium]